MFYLYCAKTFRINVIHHQKILEFFILNQVGCWVPETFNWYLPSVLKRCTESFDRGLYVEANMRMTWGFAIRILTICRRKWNHHKRGCGRRTTTWQRHHLKRFYYMFFYKCFHFAGKDIEEYNFISESITQG